MIPKVAVNPARLENLQHIQVKQGGRMIKAVYVSAVLALCASTVSAAPQSTDFTESAGFKALSGPTVSGVPAASYLGQHFTNALGCVYSRTQAAGYRVVWHAIARTRRPECPNTLPGA